MSEHQGLKLWAYKHWYVLT